jgi:hypothetical protein
MSWLKENKEDIAPGLTKMAHWSNHVILWLITEIVSVKDNLRARTQMMERIIMMAMVKN